MRARALIAVLALGCAATEEAPAPAPVEMPAPVVETEPPVEVAAEPVPDAALVRAQNGARAAVESAQASAEVAREMAAAAVKATAESGDPGARELARDSQRMAGEVTRLAQSIEREVTAAAAAGDRDALLRAANRATFLGNQVRSVQVRAEQAVAAAQAPPVAPPVEVTSVTAPPAPRPELPVAATEQVVPAVAVPEAEELPRDPAAFWALQTPLATELVADLHTNKGVLVLEFFPDVAPRHVKNFLDLSRRGFYDGLSFHRIVTGFVAQAGDPAGDGSGGPSYTIDAEFSERPHLRGTLSMARSPGHVDTAGSQFFLCLADQPQLDGSYSVFGHLLRGYEVLDAIAAAGAATQEGQPTERIVMDRIVVRPRGAQDEPSEASRP